MVDKRDIFSKMSIRERIITVCAGVLILVLAVVVIFEYVTILKTQKTINQILENQVSQNTEEKVVWVNPETTVNITEESPSRDSTQLNSSSDNEKVEYVINTNSKKIHSPECDSAIKTQENNKQTVNWTEEEYNIALDEGYSPCAICKAGR